MARKKYERKKKKAKMELPSDFIDLDAERPGGANSVDAPLGAPDDHHPSMNRSPRSGAPPSRPTPQDHVLIKGLRPIGIGDKDGRMDRGEDDDGGREDFFGPQDDDEFEPERLRGILPGLIKVGFKMGAGRRISDADAQMLTDQMIECAMSDDSFRSMLDWLPTDCMLTVGVTAFMIYLRSPKEGKGNENTLQEERSGRDDTRGGPPGLEYYLGGQSQGTGRERSDYKYSPDRLGKPGVWSGGDVWG